MPANLPPTYYAAEERWRQAADPSDKTAALEEMLRICPKHKGTDKLRADLKARLAKMRKQADKDSPAKAQNRTIPKEGAGQVVLVGPPNSGKSALVRALTKANPESADYPHTTREPTPGMMAYENIAFQLIDLPPFSAEYLESWVGDAVRRADLAWLVISAANPLTQWEQLLPVLAEKKIRLVHPEANPDRAPGEAILKTLLIMTGADLPEAGENIELFMELADPGPPLLTASTLTGAGLSDLGEPTYRALDLVRVYTRQPGHAADMANPFVLRKGSSIHDLALKIHTNIAERFKSARVWPRGQGAGLPVNRDHQLTEGDVIEIRI